MNSRTSLIAVIVLAGLLSWTASYAVQEQTVQESQKQQMAQQEDETTSGIDSYRTFVAIIGAIISMLVGLWLVFTHLKEKQLGFDTNSIKAIGLVLFIPTLILAFSVKKGISSEALSALLGAVAGYILSRSSNGEKVTVRQNTLEKKE